MNCYQNQSEEGTVFQMAPECRSSAPEPYHPLPISHTVTQSSNLHFPKQCQFRSETEPPSIAEAIFSSSGDDTNYFLLENTQLSMDSSLHCSRVCKCGHQQSEVSNPLRFRSFLGYLPEVEEEMSMPFPYSEHGSNISPPEVEFRYSYPQSLQGMGSGTTENKYGIIFSDTSNLGVRSSTGIPYFSTNTDEDHQRLEQDSSLNSSPSCCTLQTRSHEERKLLVYTPGNYPCREPDKFGVYNCDVSFLDSIYGCRNPHHEGMHSLGFNIHFQRHQSIHTPSMIRSKQPMCNSGSELPSSSSLSVSSDEMEHPQIKVGLYKTELCRSWEETGYCRYASKCQFAHGNDDLRPVPRHPKYKTELCRSYTETGLCNYGKRCRFIHTSNTHKPIFTQSRELEKKGSRRLSIFQQLSGAGEMPRRQA
uniref:C3H1-type domain-containing protein n=1 Tax=Physcomitrium patens TaxID=3218 RepID=A0A2K1L916_PHYPA|nr:uncharacterized protein LOC112287824 [Physcomitrium patens]PNR62517.1 hypothetical protein PHYPA_000941 [Physcomitrium patens]|eukprot:XP_024387074.1 uncharacterized protein LOC112287824 [Physcomitrella patens]